MKKIYTGNGDDGTTDILGSGRVEKCDSRVQFYGEVDELNSSIGWFLSHYPENDFATILYDIQKMLMDISAGIFDTKVSFDLFKEIDVLETTIDTISETLPEIKTLLIPGGISSAGLLSVIRAVARRVERCVVSLNDFVDPKKLQPVITFFNRLSDLLFVLSRYENVQAGATEKIF
ncbi:cob(I)yrinic acid a,c-diamide adenosyltransferase [Candidatus Margulisiibacteriota bacterium]